MPHLCRDFVVLERCRDAMTLWQWASALSDEDWEGIDKYFGNVNGEPKERQRVLDDVRRFIKDQEDSVTFKQLIGKLRLNNFCEINEQDGGHYSCNLDHHWRLILADASDAAGADRSSVVTYIFESNHGRGGINRSQYNEVLKRLKQHKPEAPKIWFYKDGDGFQKAANKRKRSEPSAGSEPGGPPRAKKGKAWQGQEVTRRA